MRLSSSSSESRFTTSTILGECTVRDLGLKMLWRKRYGCMEIVAVAENFMLYLCT